MWAGEVETSITKGWKGRMTQEATSNSKAGKKETHASQQG